MANASSRQSVDDMQTFPGDIIISLQSETEDQYEVELFVSAPKKLPTVCEYTCAEHRAQTGRHNAGAQNSFNECSFHREIPPP